MDFSQNLTTHLDALTEALDGSGDDVNTILTVLVDDLSEGIPSFVGLSISVSAGAEPITVTAIHSHTAATSLLLPLTAETGDGHVVFYAQNPGAFTDLAADAHIVLGAAGNIVVDGHLPPPTLAAALRSRQYLGDRSSINQALGFLIGAGYTPSRAKAELGRRATAADVSLPQIAQQILHTADEPSPDFENEIDEPDEQAG